MTLWPGLLLHVILMLVVHCSWLWHCQSASIVHCVWCTLWCWRHCRDLWWCVGMLSLWWRWTRMWHRNIFGSLVDGVGRHWWPIGYHSGRSGGSNRCDILLLLMVWLWMRWQRWCCCRWLRICRNNTGSMTDTVIMRTAANCSSIRIAVSRRTTDGSLIYTGTTLRRLVRWIASRGRKTLEVLSCTLQNVTEAVHLPRGFWNIA